MEIIQTGINDMVVVVPEVFADDRGYFFESYNLQHLMRIGYDFQFVQDNQSLSRYGVVRGLHYQLEPYAQTKLVRVLCGRIFDVAVDIRRESPTFGKWYGVEITGENKYQLLIPKGFAHGFSVISEEALVLYKTDNYYHPESERGILYNDADLDIDWKLAADKMTVSERDKELSSFREVEMNFSYKQP